MRATGKYIMVCAGIVVLFSSCITKKPVIISESKQENHVVDTSKRTSDSTVYRQRLEIKVEAVKADTVNLNVNPADIAGLPQGASFNKKSGRVTIDVRPADNGNIDIFAICDSLNVFYENFMTEYEYYWRMTNDSIDTLNNEIVKVKSQPVGNGFWAVTGKAAAAMVGLVILFFIIRKWK